MMMMMMIFKSKTIKNTTLLFVALLAVTWVPCILRHPVVYITNMEISGVAVFTLGFVSILTLLAKSYHFLRRHIFN